MNLEPRKTDSPLFESFFAVCILMGGMASASADPNHGQGGDSKAADRAFRLEQRAEKMTPRAMDNNKLLEERQRLSTAIDRPIDPNKRVNRLTPEEKRDLRRHINQAGQDLYVNIPKE